MMHRTTLCDLCNRYHTFEECPFDQLVSRRDIVRLDPESILAKGLIRIYKPKSNEEILAIQKAYQESRYTPEQLKEIEQKFAIKFQE